MKKAIQSWKIPLRQPLSEWSNDHFYLSPESSSEQGEWECLPYQTEILNAMGDDSIPYVSWMKSARTGYTKCLDIFVAYSIAVTQRSMLIVQPTDDDAKGFSKDEIAPMLRDVKCLHGLISESKKSDSSNTILKKHFIGGTMTIVGAHSPRGFRRLTKDSALFDEIDGYKITSDNEGDRLKLGEKRLMSAPFPKYIYGSTPTIKGISKIERKYDESDKRKYHVPCPHCNSFQFLEWGWDDMDYGLKYDKDNPENAYYVCKHCKEKISEKHKWDMIRDGEWIAEKPFKGHAGFHIWAAYSPFPKASWGELAKEFEEAKGDKELLKTFVNTILGETWEDETGEKLDWELLYNRREHYEYDVPDEVNFITAGIDVQDDRFEFEVVGWGAGEESWGLDYVTLHGNLSKPEIWNSLGEFLRRTYRKSDGTMLNILLACIDSGGHFTDDVYQFSKTNGAKWIIPIKGSNQPGKPVAMFPKVKNAKGVFLTMLGTDTAKEIMYSRYLINEPGNGYCHWPVKDIFNETYFKGATAEYKKKKIKNGHPFFFWFCPEHKRNEPLDCRVYALAAVRIAQQNFGVVLENGPIVANQPKKQRRIRGGVR